ncbi:MAG: uridine diphosphate-N-acetylglucosamine-binding protein YvcK [Candidatus Pacebacteria bacterium]|nr:uridine diphosphate-N-acetylglucosamine-binding protein YvcK [Candidatus Paceibacterota bacterium]
MFTNPFVKKNKKKNIVCIGGGNAMPKALLSELKKYPINITVISSVLDSGGSSGEIRKEYKMIALGDIRRAFLELSDFNPVIREVLGYRFKDGNFKEHSLGNLFLLGMFLNLDRSYNEMFIKLNSLLKEGYEVYPSTTFSTSELIAKLEDGKEIIGETNIDIPKHNPKIRIEEVYIKPKAKICPHAEIALESADAIIIGPGDLYSSLIQVLLVDGFSQAIKRTKAKKIYICNIMTKNGESNEFSVNNFTEEIEKYLKSDVDFVIYNKKNVSEGKYSEFKRKHPELLSLVSIDDNLDTEKFIGKNLILAENNPIHDSKTLVKTIMELI